MSLLLEGNAVIYCQGAFNTPNGKTAHGLVRFTRRYQVLSVIDSRYQNQDAGAVLNGEPKGIPIFATIEQAVQAGQNSQNGPTHLVIGLAPDGGRLSDPAREDVKEAIKLGLNVDSGLHDFLSEDPEIVDLAHRNGTEIRDVRKPPARNRLHFFSGKIEEVTSLKVALLGTDSAVGKRTTAWMLVQALQDAEFRAEMVGTGQTSWMQGARYCIILDSLINDFVSGEIEHVVWTAWSEAQPDVIVIEGQGSLMNPAYPGGFEILAASRPDAVVLQHAPARKDYDGFPGYPVHPLAKQIQAIQLLSGKPVVAIALNHEGIPTEDVPAVSAAIEKETGLPTMDVLVTGAEGLARTLLPFIKA
ncbi:MAG: DUF1611 domain-containing protein [Candidatus Zixiibacteriota bacterium]